MVIHDGHCVVEAPKKNWTYDDLLAVTLSGKSRELTVQLKLNATEEGR
ncbi:hypothetical protein ABID16_004523 [Rhizobium aquaticum]|uniref:Uncharacterized protein n=2 Tax=Rhizobium aquaticum TaxID=1549636 RepID=A0ABV2J8Q1_9HYPH